MLGNSFSDQDRMVAAGYENGDVKLFDLKTMSIAFETNLKNGVCALEFDRKDIKMNKLVVTGLESKFHVFDLRTQHKEKGFATLPHKQNAQNTTGWAVKHLPQNRDLFITSSGAGHLELFKYHYPPKRVTKDDNGEEVGVTGRVESLQTATLAEQPIASFDWSPDKTGLFCFAAFDQQVRVGMVTRLNAL
ncbi:WD repeat-containing protein 92 [Kappamyces sp. JEL0680]|nr:WD repeat-containing protein 92 [Kappamyces sp. JEL0680]